MANEKEIKYDLANLDLKKLKPSGFVGSVHLSVSSLKILSSKIIVN